MFVWYPFQIMSSPLCIVVSFMIFKTRLLGRGFHTLMGMLLFSLQSMWNLTIHPLGVPTYSLVHRSVSISYTICNSLSPPLIDIVCFGSLRVVISLTVLKTSMLRRGFHTFVRSVPFLSPTDVKLHNPPLWGLNVLVDTPPSVYL